MARRRMIDPNIWGSEDMAKLTIRQRLLVIGLFSNADDYGKGKANPALIRSTVFPYDDIPISEIIDDIETIRAVIAIRFYEVEGNKYYLFTNWKKWQTVQKPQDSIIPDPVENDSGMILDSFSPKGKEEKRKEEEEKRREAEGVSAAPTELILDVYVKVFKALNMSENMKLYVSKLLKEGHTETFIKEVMWECSEASERPNFKLFESIAVRWIKDGIQSREQNEASKHKGQARGKVTLIKPLVPVITDNIPQEPVSDEEYERILAKARELEGRMVR